MCELIDVAVSIEGEGKRFGAVSHSEVNRSPAILMKSGTRGLAMRNTIRLLLVLLLAAAPAAAGDRPAWVAKVPDYRSAWPEPPATGTVAPDFTLRDLSTGKRVNLKKARAHSKATLILFLDTHCRTVEQRAADLKETVARSLAIKGVTALVVFPKNAGRGGAKVPKEYAKKAGFPRVPLLYDEKNHRATVTIEYRVMVTPVAVVLDAAGKIAYYGLALGRKGSGLVPGIVAAVAAKKKIPGPAYRTPYG